MSHKIKEEAEFIVKESTYKRSTFARRGSLFKAKRQSRVVKSHQDRKSDGLRRSDSTSMEKLVQNLKKLRRNEQIGTE